MVRSTYDGRDPVEMLAEDFLREVRAGERVTADDYAQRFPLHARRIRDLFPTLLMMEQIKADQEDRQSSQSSVDYLQQHDIQQLGDFRIVRRVGCGGMGVVYEAVQESLDRRVALKVLSSSYLPTPDLVQRFEREARSAAKLHHTNIVPVFGVGQEQGVHYYIMQFIDGQALDEIVASRDTADSAKDWRRIADVGRQAAAALGYAHSMGTLHRDIKPANLLMDEHGTVWITDFGLAKRTDDADLTRPGDAVGTLRYMAPEQLSGDADGRSDIYGLGLTLYEAITNRPAFDESNRSRLVGSIAAGGPPRPRRLNASIPRDLETIVLKAIARDASDRYQTAEAMAEDLQRFAEDLPVRARRAGIAEQIWRWSKRNPAVARLAAATVFLSLCLAFVALIAYANAGRALARERQQGQYLTEARRQADLQRGRAESNLDLAISAFDEITRQITRTESVGLDAGAVPATPFSPETAAVLQTLLVFYQDFADQNGNRPELRGQLVRALQRVGDIRHKIGQHQESEQAYRRAIEICEQVGDSGAETHLCCASLRNALGSLLLARGRLVEASQVFAQARLDLNASGLLQRDHGAADRELARIHLGNAEIAHLGGHIANWDHHVGQAIRILEQRCEVSTADREATLLLAIAYHKVPPIVDRRGHKQYARDCLLSSIDLLEQLVQSHPGVADYQYRLCQSYMKLRFAPHADRRHRRREPADGEDVGRRIQLGLELARELCQTHASVPEYHILLGGLLAKRGEHFERTGDGASAEQFYRRAIQKHESIVRRHQGVPDYLAELSTARFALGRLLVRSRRSSAAVEHLQKCVDESEKYLKAVPGHPRISRQLVDQSEWLVVAIAASIQ